VKVGKEIRDQSLHAVWMCATVLLPFWGWVLLPLAPTASAVMCVVSGLSLFGIALREWWQKRDKPGGIWHHWPWLDSLGYALGAVAGFLVGFLVVV